MKLNVEMIVSVFLFIFIAINSQVLGDDFSKNWTSKIDFAKVNALRIVKSDNPLPPGYLKMVVKKIYEREELERKKLANSSGSSQKTKLFDDPKFKRFACDYYFTLKNSHHLSRIKKIKICNNLIDRLMKMVSKRLLYHSSGKPSLMMDSSGGNSSIVSTTSAPRPSSTSSIITSTESSATSISKPNEVITSTTLSSENPSQMQMVNNTELVSPSSVKTMMKNDSSTATSPPDMKDFDAEKISNDSNHSIINAMNEVKTSHPGATIKNITDVSTSSSMETSPPIAELTPKPSDHDLNNTDMSNSAIQVPNDTKNITSDTSGTFESSIQTVIRNFFLFTPTLNKINLTDSMSPPKASSINDTMINNLDKVTQSNPVAAIDNTTDVSTSSSMETSPPIAELTPKPSDHDLNNTDMSNSAIQVPNDTKNITSDTSGTFESSIQTVIRNFFLFTPTLNKINLTDSMSPPKASSINDTMINNLDKVTQSNPVAAIDNTTDVSTSSSMETSPPIAELTPKPSDHDLNNTDMSNSAIQVPNDTKNITSDTSGTFESSIQTVIRNFFLFTPTLNKINLTDSMSPPKASSINDTMINNPDKVTQPNPVAAIDNTTDVSTSSSMETSPPIAELTPKPTDNDSMTTFMRNPADLVPDDSNNITSYTPITSKSPIDIIKMLNMNNINFTVSMTTASFPINGTMINEPNKIMPLNLTAKMIVNGTNTTSPIILPQFNRRDGFEDTSDIVSSTQFPIDILMMNNSHILTPLDSTKTDPSTVLSTNNQTENTTSVSPPTITNSENSTTSKPLDSLTTDDLMSNKKQNSATSDTIPADSSIETSTMSSSHLAAHDSESQGTEPSNIPITTDSTVSSSDTSAKDPPFATTATDAANETSFDDLTPPPLSTNTSLNSSKYHSPINQTSDLNPMIPDIPSFNHSLEAPLVPGSDTNLMNQTTSSSTSGPPVSDNQIKSTTLPPQPINSTNIFSTTQVPMIPIVMTMVSSMNNHSSIDSSIRNESMSANESSTMNPSDSIPIIQTSDSNKMIPNVPSPHPSSPESDSNEKPTTLPPPPFISVNVTSTTQIPIIPIVMTMSPHPINDSSMENESNVSNLITTTTPSNSISIDDDSSRTTPNEPSKNLPSNPQNTSSTHSDPSQPLAVTPVPHESGATLPSADSFATSS